MSRRVMFALVALSLLPISLSAQATYDRLLRAAQEPQNWLTYSGGYASLRHSLLKQIDTNNAKNLEQKWVFQADSSLQNFEATPLVVDGIMYFTQPINDVVALDAKTGRVFWIYRHNLPNDIKPCCGSVNRGVAVLGNKVFFGTLDGQLIALDAKNGTPVWVDKVAPNYAAGYSLTMAPLIVKDKVITGVAGGEFGIKGYIVAFDAETGKEAWRFNTVPGPGEPGHESWQGDSWERGGGPVWLTGSYDPELNLTYWGIGNPGPDWNPKQREGDNLYSSSVVALDADTGRPKWHYQFTPNDGYDYDSVQIPVLVDMTWNGTPRKLMLWGNRNGNFYVLDRSNGNFLLGKPFVKVNWMSGFTPNGRPIQTPQLAGLPTFPGNQGGTNWYSPSFSPNTGLFYLSIWDDYGSIYAPQPAEYKAGTVFGGGSPRPFTPVPGAPAVPTLRRGAINNWTEAVGHGAVIAIDPK
ncbi:MAG TPA: PQQ-binding-like beta-propeller repeat protein, partial [Vicinamibacterales bacterium]